VIEVGDSTELVVVMGMHALCVVDSTLVVVVVVVS
jgi:hypothetical protein